LKTQRPFGKDVEGELTADAGAGGGLTVEAVRAAGRGGSPSIEEALRALREDQAARLARLFRIKKETEE
jgi:hypothetical protein